MPLANTLPELQLAEEKLRDDVKKRYGIAYVIREERPHYAGLRTEADTAQLIRWRDEVVSTARLQAENKRRREGGTLVQIREAGEVAANRAHYRVSPFGVGYHPLGAAFDIWIEKVGDSVQVANARRAAEDTRRAKGGSVVQIREAGNAAAARTAYQLVGDRAPAFGLTWGGVFKDNPGTSIVEQPDPFHFQLAQLRDVVAQKWAAHQLQVSRDRTATAGGTTALLLLLAIGGAVWWASTRAA